MTNTPISEREKGLVMSAKVFLQCADLSHDNFSRKATEGFLRDSLRAYDPKPEPVPVIPAWEDLDRYAQDSLNGMIAQYMDLPEATCKSVYNYIRKVTSRAKAPTE